MPQPSALAPRNPINKYYNGTPREVGERILRSPDSLSIFPSSSLFRSSSFRRGSGKRICPTSRSHSRRVPRPRSPRPRLRPRNFALFSFAPLYLSRTISLRSSLFPSAFTLLFFSLSFSRRPLRPFRPFPRSLVPSSFLSPHQLPFGPPPPPRPSHPTAFTFYFSSSELKPRSCAARGRA